jgi:hypothetical protein
MAQTINRRVASELDISESDSRFVLSDEEEFEENRPVEKSLCREEKIRKVLTKVDFYVNMVTYSTAAIQVLRVLIR